MYAHIGPVKVPLSLLEDYASKGEHLISLTRRMGFAETDPVESILKDIDESAMKITGISLFPS